MRLLLRRLWPHLTAPHSRRVMLRHLNQTDAIAIDQQLFNDYRFGVAQLMELAGLSCAHAIARCYPMTAATAPGGNVRVLVLCGPGNNGGDGLVCARHLAMLGYQPTVVYDPAVLDGGGEMKALYAALLDQVKMLNIPVLSEPGADAGFQLVVDALFGFSFKPPVREKWQPWMALLRSTAVPIASIDIPSGWHVEDGPTEAAIQPDMLISLTAPKLCARFFAGRHHYLGGRFVPPQMAAKYALNLPTYPDLEQCVRLPGAGDK